MLPWFFKKIDGWARHAWIVWALISCCLTARNSYKWPLEAGRLGGFAGTEVLIRKLHVKAFWSISFMTSWQIFRREWERILFQAIAYADWPPCYSLVGDCRNWCVRYDHTTYIAVLQKKQVEPQQPMLGCQRRTWEQTFSNFLRSENSTWNWLKACKQQEMFDINRSNILAQQ